MGKLDNILLVASSQRNKQAIPLNLNFNCPNSDV